MEIVKDYLESSTVHGLYYISNTRKFLRLFWMLVVIGGFVGAGYLIWSSFDNWEKSPIKTTLETLPISKITFPKVTVCPPKNTYTDLNYDLRMLKNLTLKNDTREELQQYAHNLVMNNLNSSIVRNLSMMHEKNQHYNWYHGFTKLRLPFIVPRLYYYDNAISYVIDTYATSGSITTQYFGEKFDADKLELDILYKLRLMVPDSIISNPNASIHFTIQKVTIQNLKSGRDNLFVGGLNFNDYNEFKAISKPYTKEYLNEKCQCYIIYLDRKVSREDIVNIKTDQMPGWNISWYYTGLGKAEAVDKLKNVPNNHQFLRYEDKLLLGLSIFQN